MPGQSVQVLRVAAVVALVCAAAALASPPGRIPLALRGLARALGGAKQPAAAVPAWRKWLALALVAAAVAIACAGGW